MDRRIKVKKLPAFSGREIVISDLHGELDLYLKLLKKCSYVPGKDRLLLLGDLIEKGPRSLDLTRHIMKQFEANENIHALMGNCDFTAKNCLYSYRLDFIHQVLLERRASLIHEMAAEIGLPAMDEKTDLSDYFALIRRHFLKELAFLNDLPHVIETPRRVYVHAGIDRLDHYGNEIRDVMTFPFFAASSRVFSRPVVAGHMPVSEYCRQYADFNVRYDAVRCIYSIDGGNGVKKAGQLNALIFEGTRAWSLAVDNLPQVQVKKSVDPDNQTSFYIPFNQGGLQLLEKGKIQSRVYSPYLRRTFWIDNSFLHTFNGQLKGVDFTTYRLPLTQGEWVSLVRTFQDQALIKKNGVMGLADLAVLNPY